MSDSRRITKHGKLRRAIERAGTRLYNVTRERRRWRGVLLSFALHHHGHDYAIREVDSTGAIV